MTNLGRELRRAGRTLLHRPLTAVLMVGTLALGIAANVVLFAYVSRLLWEGLDAPEPERVFRLQGASAKEPDLGLSYPDWQDYRRALHSSDKPPLEELTVARVFSSALATPGGDSRFEWGWLVGGDYFSLLGKAPYLGRWLSLEDDSAEAPRAVVISYRLWQRRFAGDRQVIGRSVLLDGQFSYTVVGVAPPGFAATGLPLGIYLPFAHWQDVARGLSERSVTLGNVYGRLAPGASRAGAAAFLAGVARGLDQQAPLAEPRLIRLVSQDEDAGTDRSLTLHAALVSTVVALVLLLASANAGTLMLARALERQRELAVAAALGAGRWSLVRSLLSEVALVATLAGLLGTALGWLGIQLLEPALHSVPVGRGNFGEEVIALRFDDRVAFFALAATMMTAVLLSLPPLATASARKLLPSLRSAAGVLAAGARSRLASFLVVLQTALATLLLTGALLLTTSLVELRRVDPGFDTHSLYLASFYLAGQPGPGANATAEAWSRCVDDLVQRVRILPGVRSTGLVAQPPLYGGAFGDQLLLPGNTEPIEVNGAAIGPGYLETLGAALVAGRTFGPEDRADSERVAVVNRRFAEKFFPRGALGQTLTVVGGPRPDDRGPYRIVGVVADTRYLDLRSPIGPLAYYSWTQRPWKRASLLVRASGNSAALVHALDEAMAASTQGLATVEVAPLDENLERALLAEQLNAQVSGWIGLFGLILASAGTASVVAHSVARRSREIALRMALGSNPSQALNLVLGEAARLVLRGLLLGLAGALAAGRLLQSQLFGIRAHEPWALATVAAALAAAALLSAYGPAQRAARIEPARLLSRE
ncbi:MAG: ADOP family duplicated permease [Thermoanaerobaculia bacterium]